MSGRDLLRRSGSPPGQEPARPRTLGVSEADGATGDAAHASPDGNRAASLPASSDTLRELGELLEQPAPVVDAYFRGRTDGLRQGWRIGRQDGYRAGIADMVGAASYWRAFMRDARLLDRLPAGWYPASRPKGLSPEQIRQRVDESWSDAGRRVP